MISLSNLIYLNMGGKADDNAGRSAGKAEWAHIQTHPAVFEYVVKVFGILASTLCIYDAHLYM